MSFLAKFHSRSTAISELSYLNERNILSTASEDRVEKENENHYDEVLSFRIKLYPCELVTINESPTRNPDSQANQLKSFFRRFSNCGPPKLTCFTTKIARARSADFR